MGAVVGDLGYLSVFLLAGLALALFLFDIAQRRLDLFREPARTDSIPYADAESARVSAAICRATESKFNWEGEDPRG